MHSMLRKSLVLWMTAATLLMTGGSGNVATAAEAFSPKQQACGKYVTVTWMTYTGVDFSGLDYNGCWGYEFPVHGPVANRWYNCRYHPERGRRVRWGGNTEVPWIFDDIGKRDASRPGRVQVENEMIRQCAAQPGKHNGYADIYVAPSKPNGGLADWSLPYNTYPAVWEINIRLIFNQLYSTQERMWDLHPDWVQQGAPGVPVINVSNNFGPQLTRRAVATVCQEVTQANPSSARMAIYHFVDGSQLAGARLRPIVNALNACTAR